MKWDNLNSPDLVKKYYLVQHSIDHAIDSEEKDQRTLHTYKRRGTALIRTMFIKRHQTQLLMVGYRFHWLLCKWCKSRRKQLLKFEYRRQEDDKEIHESHMRQAVAFWSWQKEYAWTLCILLEPSRMSTLCGCTPNTKCSPNLQAYTSEYIEEIFWHVSCTHLPYMQPNTK